MTGDNTVMTVITKFLACARLLVVLSSIKCSK